MQGSTTIYLELSLMSQFQQKLHHSVLSCIKHCTGMLHDKLGLILLLLAQYHINFPFINLPLSSMLSIKLSLYRLATLAGLDKMWEACSADWCMVLTELLSQFNTLSLARLHQGWRTVLRDTSQIQRQSPAVRFNNFPLHERNWY